MVFMFSGQGSQYHQMGRDLYDFNPVFREVIHQGEIIIQRCIHRSVINELYGCHLPDQFDDLIMTHSALVLVECAIFQVLVSEGLEPDCVWGSSLGEFAAAVAAGVWSLETALTAAIEQARNVMQYCPYGGMIAILESPNLYYSANELRENSTLAGVNFSRHFTVSATQEKLEFVETYLKNRNISYVRLPVQYAFHSVHIDEAMGSFENFCKTLPPLDNPQIHLYSSMTGGRLGSIARNHFWEAVRQPINFQKAFFELEKKGYSAFVDCGPSGTLATFVKNNLAKDSKSLYFSTTTQFRRAMSQITLIKENQCRLKVLSSG